MILKSGPKPLRKGSEISLWSHQARCNFQVAQLAYMQSPGIILPAGPYLSVSNNEVWIDIQLHEWWDRRVSIYLRCIMKPSGENGLCRRPSSSLGAVNLTMTLLSFVQLRSKEGPLYCTERGVVHPSATHASSNHVDTLAYQQPLSHLQMFNISEYKSGIVLKCLLEWYHRSKVKSIKQLRPRGFTMSLVSRECKEGGS